MVGCADEVPPNPKQVQDDPVNREESLRLTDRFEAAHLSLSLSRRLMRDLRSVVGVLPRIVADGGYGAPMRSAITPQLVGHQAQRLCTLALQ